MIIESVLKEINVKAFNDLIEGSTLRLNQDQADQIAELIQSGKFEVIKYLENNSVPYVKMWCKSSKLWDKDNYGKVLVAAEFGDFLLYSTYDTGIGSIILLHGPDEVQTKVLELISESL